MILENIPPDMKNSLFIMKNTPNFKKKYTNFAIINIINLKSQDMKRLDPITRPSMWG